MAISRATLPHCVLTGSGGAIFMVDSIPMSHLLTACLSITLLHALCGVLNIDDFHHHNVKVIGSTFNYNEATGQSNGGGVVCVKTVSYTHLTLPTIYSV